MKWKCDACGTVHGSNPSRCSNCGHTILSQHAPADAPAASTHSSGPSWWLPALVLLALAALGVWLGLGAVP